MKFKNIIILILLIGNQVFGSEIGLRGINLGDDGKSSCSKMKKIVMDKIDIYSGLITKDNYQETKKQCGFFIWVTLMAGLEMDKNNKVQKIVFSPQHFGFDANAGQQVVAQEFVNNVPWVNNLSSELSPDQKGYDYVHTDLKKGFKIRISYDNLITLEKTADSSKLNF